MLNASHWTGQVILNNFSSLCIQSVLLGRRRKCTSKEREKILEIESGR